MNRNKELQSKRTQFIKDYINNSSLNVGEAIKELSEYHLYIAESTIWKDYIK